MTSAGRPAVTKGAEVAVAVLAALEDKVDVDGIAHTKEHTRAEHAVADTLTARNNRQSKEREAVES